MTPRGRPVGRGVTAGTLRCRKRRSHMVRNAAAHRLGGVVLILVAAVAIRVRRSEVVIVIQMAGGAGRRHMRARQRPTRYRVIERVIGPCDRVVASGAVRRRKRGSRRRVRRIVSLLPRR